MGASSQRAPGERERRIFVLPARVFAAALGLLVWIRGHDLAYQIVGLEPSESIHAYLPVADRIAMLAAVISLARFVWLLAVHRPDPADVVARTALRRLPLWTVPSGLGFVVVELAERSFTGAPTALLVAGAAVQLILGAAALLASRRVLRAAVWVVARATRRSGRSAVVLARLRCRASFAIPAGPLRGAGGCRAPPFA